MMLMMMSMMTMMMSMMLMTMKMIMIRWSSFWMAVCLTVSACQAIGWPSGHLQNMHSAEYTVMTNVRFWSVQGYSVCHQFIHLR